MEPNNKLQFVIDNNPIVDWPVTVKLPTAGGKFTEYQFTVSMRVLSPRQYEALLDRNDSPVKAGAEITEPAPVKPAPKMSETTEQNVPIFQRLITDWQGVADRDGNAVDYSLEKLAEQVTGPRGPALSTGLWRAISEVRYGARLGN